jgi:tight adherence protein B
MGAVVGLLAGLGATLIIFGLTSASTIGPAAVRPTGRLARLVEQSGIARVTVANLVGACAAAGLVAFVAALLVTAVPIAALLAGTVAAATPVVLLKRRVNARARALRGAWPDAVDGLISAVRAGMSLPEAVSTLGRRGPEPLRVPFSEFESEYRATGSFLAALAVLQDELRCPIADRVIASLRIAREVGGTDLGTVLRTLSTLLREDARTRGDIEAKQSWTVSAARLAVAAPWITLALLCTRPAAVSAYSSTAGAVVLLIAAGLSVIAYRVMLAIGRLPVEQRMVTS